MKKKVCYSEDDLENLYNKALQTAPFGPPTQVTHLCRNKPREEFEEMVSEFEGMMLKKRKDPGNDPFNPINNTAYGIFFAPLPCKNYLDYFGNTQITIPINYFFRFDMRIYFSDYYCFNYAPHYVTLVLAKEDSKSDDFCVENLYELDLYDNPFFITKHGNYFSFFSNKLKIEIFYMHDIELACAFKMGAFIETNRQERNKANKKKWRHKNKNCSNCNLDFLCLKQKGSYELESTRRLYQNSINFSFSNRSNAFYVYNENFSKGYNLFLREVRKNNNKNKNKHKMKNHHKSYSPSYIPSLSSSPSSSSCESINIIYEKDTKKNAHSGENIPKKKEKEEKKEEKKEERKEEKKEEKKEQLKKKSSFKLPSLKLKNIVKPEIKGETTLRTPSIKSQRRENQEEAEKTREKAENSKKKSKGKKKAINCCILS